MPALLLFLLLPHALATEPIGFDQAVSEALSILSSDDAHDTFTKTFNFVQVVQKKTDKRETIKARETKRTIERTLKNPK